MARFTDCTNRASLKRLAGASITNFGIGGLSACNSLVSVESCKSNWPPTHAKPVSFEPVCADQNAKHIHGHKHIRLDQNSTGIFFIKGSLVANFRYTNFWVA